MKNLYLVMLLLVIIGAINWGLVGLFNLDLVALIFGSMSIISRIVYVLVGISGIGLLFYIKALMKCCDDSTCGTK